MITFELEEFHDPRPFARLAEPFLLRHEALHCLQLGIIDGIARGEWPRPYMAVVRRGNEPVLLALRTPPHALILSRTDSPEAVRVLADELRRRDPEARPGEVMGPAEVADEFARRWAAPTGWRAEPSGRERIYQLEEVVPVTGVPGAPRRATREDHELLVAWYQAFHEEALPGFPVSAVAAVERALASAHRELWLWVDGSQPVALAGAGSPTASGIRIGPVYTPPARRRRGYASALVAALSQQLLDSGREFCFLFTDLNNPTSNHIYQEIGYRPVSDVHKYALQGPPT